MRRGLAKQKCLYTLLGSEIISEDRWTQQTTSSRRISISLPPATVLWS